MGVDATMVWGKAGTEEQDPTRKMEMQKLRESGRCNGATRVSTPALTRTRKAEKQSSRKNKAESSSQTANARCGIRDKQGFVRGMLLSESENRRRGFKEKTMENGGMAHGNGRRWCMSRGFRIRKGRLKLHLKHR